MRKLLKELNKWNLNKQIEISNWQRDILFAHIVETITDIEKSKIFKSKRGNLKWKKPN